MKKSFTFLFILFTFFRLEIFGQTGLEPKIIEVKIADDGNKTIDISQVEEIEKGEWYQLKITGINLNNYQVILDNSDSILISALSVPDIQTFSLEAISKALEGIDQSGISTIFKQSIPSFGGLFMPKLMELNNNIDIVKQADDIWFEALEKQEEEKVIAIVKAEMMGFEKEITEFKNSLENVRTEFDDWAFNIYQYELDAKKNIPKVTDFWKKKPLETIIEIRSRSNKLKAKIFKSQEKYKAYSEGLSDEIKKMDAHKKLDKAIKEAYTKLIEVAEIAQKGMTADVVKKILLPIIELDNNKSRTFFSLPQQFKGEQATVTLQLKPWGKSQSQTYPTSFKFPIKSGNYKGVGVSYYFGGLHDDVISAIGEVAPGDTIQTFNLVKENVTKVEMGTALLLRIGKKMKKHPKVGGHGTFGLGLSLSDKLRPRFLAGGGLTFGKIHMFAIDAGFLAGYVEKESKVFENRQSGLLENPADTTISTLKCSYFVSLGYVYKF